MVECTCTRIGYIFFNVSLMVSPAGFFCGKVVVGRNTRHRTSIYRHETPDEAYCACAEWLMTRGAENIREGRTGDCWDPDGN